MYQNKITQVMFTNKCRNLFQEDDIYFVSAEKFLIKILNLKELYFLKLNEFKGRLVRTRGELDQKPAKKDFTVDIFTVKKEVEEDQTKSKQVKTKWRLKCKKGRLYGGFTDWKKGFNTKTVEKIIKIKNTEKH